MGVDPRIYSNAHAQIIKLKAYILMVDPVPISFVRQCSAVQPRLSITPTRARTRKEYKPRPLLNHDMQDRTTHCLVVVCSACTEALVYQVYY